MAEVKEVGQRVTYDITGLSEEELALIYALVMNTGGSPKDSPREHADSLARALDKTFENARMDELYARFSILLNSDPCFDAGA